MGNAEDLHEIYRLIFSAFQSILYINKLSERMECEAVLIDFKFKINTSVPCSEVTAAMLSTSGKSQRTASSMTLTKCENCSLSWEMSAS